ncbi:sensor histidine kinase [Nonomuraea spiralis]|uniref:histidine kinase n=1 Tax=Nonomuraea spiralis TaxID=46182 RepID=A0ABV5I7L9_9ACTN|nr:histidine kinase [Nonomuraea spiralis]GGT09693.1 two-component sensor histidine kinase [Nonomuraea spiralis]
MRPRRADVLLALVAGVPLVPLSLTVAVLSVPGTRAVLLAGACLVAHAALAYRREMWAFLVVAGAFAVQAAVTGLFLVLPSALVFPLAVYSCAAHARRCPPLAVGLAGAGLAAARFATDSSVEAAGLGPDPWLLAGLLAAVVVAAWGLGLYRRTQLAHVDLLRERAREAAARATAEERARIAREMHDVVAHALAVIVAQARGGRFAPARAEEILATIEETARAALTDMRAAVGVLRAESGAAAEAGPPPGLAGLPDLVARTRGAGLPVEEVVRGTPHPLGPGADLVAYRVVQEALTNTLRHAGPGARSTLRLEWADDALRITAGDAGGRARFATRGDGPGNGLAGMRERVTEVGGTLDVRTEEAGGFVVEARLPYRT